jgi:hypothetical protein
MVTVLAVPGAAIALTHVLAGTFVGPLNVSQELLAPKYAVPLTGLLLYSPSTCPQQTCPNPSRIIVKSNEFPIFLKVGKFEQKSW